MERGLYIAASGMMAEMVRQDQLGNDLANASTPGYKPDRTTQSEFGSLLLSNSLTGRPIGTLGLGVHDDRTVTDTTPVPLRETDEPLDFGIAGLGWFAVRTAQGVRYTRDGQFTTSPQGTLTTLNGDPVLSQNGQTIPVAPGGKVSPQALGVFAVSGVKKQGDDLVTGTPGGRATGVVRQGYLEGSGSDPARTMVDMIASLRAFQSGQKAIQTIDETLDKAATDVGRIA